MGEFNKNIDDVLKDVFGFKEFRPGQREVIESILSGRDTIAIFPTGGGKSVCFQIPALIFPGTSVVISPLISLMKDQVDELKSKNIPATYISSLLSDREVNIRLKEISKGHYKIVYIAPERFYSDSFVAALERITISFVAVDEAHCVSQWGHNFRPAYLKIKDFVKAVGNPVAAAFTATANKKVQEDMASLLGLSNCRLYISSFDRPNLEFRLENPFNKKKYIKELIQRNPNKPMIIYASTRRNVEELHFYLRNNQIKSGMYHGGLGNRYRNIYQDEFLKGTINVMVATNAFGMGIDKSDVRYIIHYNMPASIENYYQESGRAGRDGEKAFCILLKNNEDLRVNEFLIESNYPPVKAVKRLYKSIKRMKESGLNIDSLLNKASNEYRIMESALRKLAEYEYITIRNGIAYCTCGSKFELTQSMINKYKDIELRKLNAMLEYTRGKSCLRAYILEYFNETPPNRSCGNCSICL